MNIVESVRRILEDMLLTEMAYNRRVAIDKIRALQHHLTTHIMKVVHNPGHQASNHWKGEIQGAMTSLRVANNLKGNKRLDPKVIRDLIIDEPLGEYNQYADTHDVMSNHQGPVWKLPASRVNYSKTLDVARDIAKYVANEHSNKVAEIFARHGL